MWEDVQVGVVGEHADEGQGVDNGEHGEHPVGEGVPHVRLGEDDDADDVSADGHAAGS